VLTYGFTSLTSFLGYYLALGAYYCLGTSFFVSSFLCSFSYGNFYFLTSAYLGFTGLYCFGFSF